MNNLVTLILTRCQETVLHFIREADNQDKNKVERAFADLTAVLAVWYRYGQGEEMISDAVNKALKKSLKAARDLAEDPPEE